VQITANRTCFATQPQPRLRSGIAHIENPLEPQRPESPGCTGDPPALYPDVYWKMGPQRGVPACWYPEISVAGGVWKRNVSIDNICRIAVLSDGRWRMTREQAYTPLGLDKPCSSWRYPGSSSVEQLPRIAVGLRVASQNSTVRISSQRGRVTALSAPR
jgi:hypothetical protein